MTVASLADDLALDPADVRLAVLWLADHDVDDGRLDPEMELAVREFLDPDHDRATLGGGCPGCGRMPGPGLVLVGWAPCSCGGHQTTLCRDDRDGCGTERWDPPRDPDSCSRPAFGFSAPQ